MLSILVGHGPGEAEYGTFHRMLGILRSLNFLSLSPSYFSLTIKPEKTGDTEMSQA